MKKDKKKKRKLPLIPAAAMLIAAGVLCCGCGFDGEQTTLTVNEDGSIPIGNRLLVEPFDSGLTLTEQYDTLAADGLYYAAWTIGDPVDYENSDGDDAKLYDAQLYLLLGEYRTKETASENADSWISAAKENYEILSEEDISYGFVTYHVITYNCSSETNPYDHGVSAFASVGENAVCAELTCQADFSGDAKSIMEDFLNHCTYQ